MALKFKTCENCRVLWCSLQNLVEKALELLDQFQKEQEMKNQVGAMETSLVFRLSHESLGVRLHRNVSAPSHILFTPSLSLSTSPPPPSIVSKQMLFNCRFAALMVGDLPKAVSLLEELGSDKPPPHLVRVTLPEWARESLQQSVATSGDEILKASLEVAS